MDWTPAVAGLRAAALVPARTLADVARTMDAGIPVTIAFTTAADDAAPGPAAPQPAAGHDQLRGRRAAADRPADRAASSSGTGRRFPAEFGCRAELPAELFIEAVRRRVSLVADRASPVRLGLLDGMRARGGGQRDR